MNRSIEALLTVACLVLVPRIGWSEEVVQSIRWQEATRRVTHQGGASATFPLVTIGRPRISQARYALRGQIKYQGVTGGSYLEMWSQFSEGSFFSRTLDQSGPMRRLEGSSEWRNFVLPFSNREGGSPPEKLVFNLVMAGAGSVEIGPVELVQFAADENLFADSTAWWSDRQAGLLGGIVGSALGILGALIGWLGSTGRAKSFVLGTLKGMAWLGVGAIGAGALALAAGQAYAVYYPLLLLGTIGAALGFSLPRSLNRRYEDVELRRMQALDA